MELNRMFTVLANVDFCDLKCVFNSFTDQNGMRAVRIWHNKLPTMWTTKMIKLIKWPLGDVFSSDRVMFPSTLFPFCQSGSHIFGERTHQHANISLISNCCCNSCRCLYCHSQFVKPQFHNNGGNKWIHPSIDVLQTINETVSNSTYPFSSDGTSQLQ